MAKKDIERKIVDYRILSNTAIGQLERRVMAAIKEGWTLQGGVAISGGSFIQAVVLYEEVK